MYSRLGLAVLASSLSVAVAAAPSQYAPGGSLTTGSLSNKYQLSSLSYNPASASQLLDKDENIRFGYWSSFGMSTEFGDVSNFEDEINRLSDELDKDDLTLTDAQDLVDDFNAILPTLGEEGYMRLNFGGSIPLMPVVFHVSKFPALKGNFFVDGGMELLTGGRFLDEPVSTQVIGTTASITTQSSVYIKSGTGIRIGFGYAQSVWSGGADWKAGTLFVGAKADLHSVSLSKQVILLDDVDDLGDTLEDDYDQNEETTTGVALSVGALWKADRYQVGLTMHNINEPEFEYGQVGVNCSALTGTSQTNCFQAANFAAAGRIDSIETHTMYAYTNLEGSFFIKPNLAVNLSYDLGEHEDFVGDDYQWMVASLFYQPDHWSLPGFRVGYKTNQVGSELSSATFGITFFSIANFDLEYGLDTTEVDGSSAPRNFAINFGLEERF